MANYDKGRRKWGDISQESENYKYDDRLSGGMRGGGGNRAPPQALYRPGSGPLRKSGRGDEFENDNNFHHHDRIKPSPPPQQQQQQQQPPPASIAYRLRNCQFPNSSSGQEKILPSSCDIDDVSSKFNDLHVNYKNSSNHHHNQGSSKLNHHQHHIMSIDPRKKNKKPEQQLYVPKKVKEALAERDVINRSPVHHNWDKDREREDHRDWDIRSNRSQHSDNYRNRQIGMNQTDSIRRNDDHSKRYSGNRRNRNPGENEDRWRSDSPSGKNYGNRRDNSREVRQGSEPLYIPSNNKYDSNRIRDTRSVEPGYPDKFQGKPPSGRHGMKEFTIPKNTKLESLPPRFRKKYLAENGVLPPSSNNIGITSEEAWDGSTVTFQGSSRYPPAIQHSHTMQNLPPSGPLPPQANWSNTVPVRSRGRGRHRNDELENLASFRPVTPDQYSAQSSRSHTPSQDYGNRYYDRRGSNSTMYTSIESLNRMDSMLMPPPRAPSPATSIPYRNTCPSPDNQWSYKNQRANTQEKPKPQPISNVTSPKSETFDSLPEKIDTLDWGEEVELNERLEAEQLSRSSSVLSLRGNSNASQSTSGGSKKRKKNRRGGRDRSGTRDRFQETSRERQNNQQNRENDNYNNNQNNSRRFDNRRRSAIQRSRESSKERSRGRNHDDFYRNRISDQPSDENWRTGRRVSICDSEDGRRTPCSSSHSTVANSSSHQSPSSFNNSQPGVLVLPDTNTFQPSTTPPRLQSQQQRTLFDPNNPNKPIIVTSTGGRTAPKFREMEGIAQAEVPVFQSLPGMFASHSNFQGAQGEGGAPAPYFNEQLGNSRPSWYDPYSESFRSAKHHFLLLDIERADLELQWIISSGGLQTHWERVSYIRHFLQQSLQNLLETDIKFCQKENVEQHFWKILFYNMIEILRKNMPKENAEGRERCKQIMLNIIDEGTVYLENLLAVLERVYNFKIDPYLTSSMSPKGLGIIGLVLISAQKIFLFLGDLARYKEQTNETTNYGKSRHWYLKAQQINPKNGRPYNQLALLAHYARRKLDAVYYYMRSLMASNPFQSARESLIALFDENRKKYESTERKRKEEREWKERARMKEKEGSNNIGGSLRRETWIHPGGKRMRRTTSASTANETIIPDSDSEDLAQLTSVEVNKRFITSYLHVHGKLITKIGMETFQEAGIQMLREFRALLQHSPLPLPGTRLLQLLALNMFAIETTQLKDSQMEQGYRSEVQERALVVSLQMFSLILERGVSLLKSQLEGDELPKLVVGEDLQVLLPAIKIWCDWMLCHSTVWNPPPSCTDYRVGPPGDAWSRLATLVNFLEKLTYPKDLLISTKDAQGREEDLELVKLPEDTTLAGFTPLMSNPQDAFFTQKTEDMEVVQVCLRISKILFFGQVFLCGLETPVLKLQKSETGISEYVSVVEASSASSPSSPPSDSELLVESYSEDDEDSPATLRRLSSSGEIPSDTLTSQTPVSEIRSLIERKEELERRQKKQDHHRQRVQAILSKSSVSVEIEVRPRQLVPDTNCFIDYLPQLQSIAKAVSGAQPIYTLMVPLVVLNELEGLTRGAGTRDSQPSSRAALNPEHVARVAENAKAALAFARSRNPAIRCLTTRGTVLSSSTFTVEEDVTQDGLTRNDDRILATCLSLCRTNSKDQIPSVEGQPRRLRRDVVLLTEDRNLRVKALARDVPVREIPDFVQWAGLG
ncbi:telomerase-binding protein EST1A-like isoform X3 [Leptopilina heterotoma]|uniref:telomerase-binding protein EST1A-like isoform X3 n=1 Tax=Leptopilina heterotoma TaxID=63436 RepID=UPI001CA9E7C0|nr:telomerase-binding protein EST1A-like isoform X3 [Leptopilina heterotoma]